MIKSRKKSWWRLLLFVPLAVLGYFAWVFFIPNISPKSDKNGYLLIRDGATLPDVTKQLDEKANVACMSGFKQVAKYLKYNNIKSGRYKLTKGMSNFALVRALRNGKQTPVSLKLNNIRTKEQLAGKLSQQLMVDSAEVVHLLNDTAFLTKYKLNPYTSIAVFLPNTYEMLWNTGSEKLFQRMYTEYEKFWNSERRQQASNIPMTRDEVITLASIVDAETNSKAEKAVVAGLYINRLKRNMPLQADPTIIFALNDFGIKRVTIAMTQFESPYNTYRHTGLPPGPIRIPNLNTIDYVLNYDRNDYIFMCAKETLNGEHNFASTWAEHSANAKRYQQALNERGIK